MSVEVVPRGETFVARAPTDIAVVGQGMLQHVLSNKRESGISSY
jgi:hypothetical protein